MDIEKIEALLMDHALGGTSEEVAALVEAFVEKDAAARGRLEELCGTVGLAKRVMGADVPSAMHAQGPFPEHGTRGLPALPRAAIERSLRRAMWKRRVLAGAAMAACVVLGTFCGRFWTTKGIDRVVIVRAAESAARPAEVAVVRDFWSVDRLRAAAQEASRETPQTTSVAFGKRITFRNTFGGGL